ncbi:alpha/beta hydrolase [Sphingomonas sp. BIUV-7]|uniref:Alpha/beta hydrolase n=1 Tax=Sphingomonas natans TaxID=3063330 RepID=A0ABT8Y8B1_9SPHN|nr:alpha/beta hydrolase [Sphingomonas sp. BIUV-7]MDO6414557.1 alpha/beta hydrolase [Sphingomonas sp. BIUV-7]
MADDVRGAEALLVPARFIPLPSHVSDAARAYLGPFPELQAYPGIDDLDAWRAYVNSSEQAILPLLRHINGRAAVTSEVETRAVGEAGVFLITPRDLPAEDRGVILEFHGGGLITCAGELCELMGTGLAARLNRRVWAVDYRMPPDHPYPAALDDGVTVYRALLQERAPQEIVVSGGSAGGNLAAAVMLRARDEGLPLPAGVILNTPELDLTESGDSFHTNLGIDPGLRSLMPVNLLYAGGHDLSHPYLSPLFGDLADFPPTLLTSGTRDLYLSNTVRMHRALRKAGVPAQLHLLEAGAHTGFPGSPEGDEINREISRFLEAVW